MNYQRVYAEFIADRNEKQASLKASGEYFEVHHIVPRSLGGSDDDGNLVALTAEDHLRAHLLLAKIHGGKMWCAVKYILTGKQNARIPGRKIRSAHALSKRARSVYIAGKFKEMWRDADYRARMTEALRNKTVYELKTLSGIVVAGTWWELVEKTGLPEWKVKNLCRGDVWRSGDWYCPKHNPDGLGASEISSARMRDNNPGKLQSTKKVASFLWYKRKDEMDGYRKLAYTEKARKKRAETLKTSERWRTFLARWDRNPNYGEDHHNYNHTKFTWVNKKTGEVVAATKREMQNLYGGHSGNWAAVVAGRIKSSLGWKIAA